MDGATGHVSAELPDREEGLVDDKPVVVDGIPISICQARGSQTLHPPILFLAHIHPMVFLVFLSVAEELAQLACRVSSSQVADQHPPGPLASS